MRVLFAFIVLLCAGCASTYTTPGGAAGLDQLGHTAIADGSSGQPAPQFPASLAVVRVQGASYRSRSAAGEDSGRFTVAVPQELPTAEQLRQIAAWPAVESAAPLNRDWLPGKLESLDDLRTVAAKMQVDVLLVFTVDTTFEVQGKAVEPSGSIETGDKQHGPATVTAKASASFVDVRTGYEYANVEGAAASADIASALGSADAVDRKRIEVESAAFTQLLTNAAMRWAAIAQQYQ